MSRSLGVVLAVCGMLVVGIGVADATGPVVVQLTPQNGSNESGTATLTESGAKTKVVVAINGHKSAQDAQTYVFCGNVPNM